MLDKFWRNLSALIRFFCTKLFTNVNGKAAREILADFKKKLIYSTSSQFFFGFVRSKYIHVLYKNVLGFTLHPLKKPGYRLGFKLHVM